MGGKSKKDKKQASTTGGTAEKSSKDEQNK